MHIEKLNPKQWKVRVSPSTATEILDTLDRVYCAWEEALAKAPDTVPASYGDELGYLACALQVDREEGYRDPEFLVGRVGAVTLGWKPDQPTPDSGRNIV